MRITSLSLTVWNCEVTCTGPSVYLRIRSLSRAPSKSSRVFWSKVPCGVTGFPLSSTPMRIYPPGGRFDIDTTSLTNLILPSFFERSTLSLNSRCCCSGSDSNSVSFSMSVRPSTVTAIIPPGILFWLLWSKYTEKYDRMERSLGNDEYAAVTTPAAVSLAAVRKD